MSWRDVQALAKLFRTRHVSVEERRVGYFQVHVVGSGSPEADRLEKREGGERERGERERERVQRQKKPILSGQHQKEWDEEAEERLLRNMQVLEWIGR